MTATQILLTVPEWFEKELARLPLHMKTQEQRMAAVIRFSELNIEHGTGGPFAAGVFERESGKLVSMGVNRVVPMNCSSAHGEIMALSLAQQSLGTYDLGGKGLPAHEIAVNWRPCAMCFGALLWSGVRSLVIAGSGPELEEITGFDEGPLPPRWIEELKLRGIDFGENVLKDEACKVFRKFRDSGSLVYNSRLGG